MSKGATIYAGSPHYNAVALQSPIVTAVAGSFNGTLTDELGGFGCLAFQLNVTAAAALAGDTLDVYMQTTIDGTNWIDIVHFNQALGNGGASIQVGKIGYGNDEPIDTLSTALAAGSVRHIFGVQYRVRYVVADSGSHGQSFTWSVIANLL